MTGTERSELAWFVDRRNYASLVENSGDPESTKLHREVPFPWAGFDSTGYTKGALFIKTLEDIIARAAFDDFLRSYFRTFAFRWVDDQAFLSHLRATVLDARPGLEQQLQLQEWLYAPGLPTNTTAPTTSALYELASQRATSFVSGASLASMGASTWRPDEAELFLQLIPLGALAPRMAEIDAAFGYSLQNAPPLAWTLRAIYTGYQPSNAAIERAAARGGSNSAIVQIYNVMMNADRDRALTLFAKYRDRYHDAIEARIAEMLGLNGLTRAAA